MYWHDCLWFMFGHCRNISTPCTKCRYNQPTPEEFNKIYKEFQEWVKKGKEFDKQICKRNRKWEKWVNKKHVRHFTTY